MRLIDADALKAKIPSTNMEIFEMCLLDVEKVMCLLDAEKVRTLIDEAPTIEPKQGKWIVSYIDGIKQTECSACGESFTTYDVYGWRYCPWCGVKMDGERREP